MRQGRPSGNAALDSRVYPSAHSEKASQNGSAPGGKSLTKMVLENVMALGFSVPSGWLENQGPQPKVPQFRAEVGVPGTKNIATNYFVR